MTVNYDNIPKELINLKQWVCSWENSKLPMKAWEYKAASSIDPDTWETFEFAKTSVDNGAYDYLGFVFNDNGIVGIDIDVGWEDGLPTPISTDIIGVCKSYTEKSKSGRGFHILIKGDLPFSGKNNLEGVEIYKSSRYFIMTGDVILFDKIVENQKAIDYVVEKYFKTTTKSSDNTVSSGKRIYYIPFWENIISNRKIRLNPTYPKIPNGNRNISLTSLAGTIHSLGFGKKVIYNELKKVNNIACCPPIGDNELLNICNSVTKYSR